MEIVKTQKGKDMIYHDGYLYTRDTLGKDFISWRCEDRSCKGRIHTHLEYHDGDEPKKFVKPHGHTPNPGVLEKKKILQQMKEKAKEDLGTSTRGIIQEGLHAASDEVVNLIGSRSNLTRRINYTRGLAHPGEQLPAEIRSITIPENLKKTDKGEVFLLHDSFSISEEENRIFIFGTHTFLDHLLRLVDHILLSSTVNTKATICFD